MLLFLPLFILLSDVLQNKYNSNEISCQPVNKDFSYALEHLLLSKLIGVFPSKTKFASTWYGHNVLC